MILPEVRDRIEQKFHTDLCRCAGSMECRGWHRQGASGEHPSSSGAQGWLGSISEASPASPVGISAEDMKKAARADVPAA